MKFRLKFRNNVTDQCMGDFYNVILFFNFKNIYDLAREGRLWCWFYAFHFIISESYYFITLVSLACLIILKYEKMWKNEFSINTIRLFNFQIIIISSYILENIAI